MPLNRNSEQLERLLRSGQARGYILYEEIDKILPLVTGETAVDLDTVLSEMVMNSVEVMDKPRTEDSLPHANTFDDDESQNPNLPSIKHYIRELASVPRLTLKAEKELAQRVREARAGFTAADMNKAAWIHAVDGTGAFYTGLGMAASSENRAMQKAEEAANQLIEANLWIALATATHYTHRGLGLLELVQEGNIGLMRAVREYNDLRPYRFATYATWWVRRSIIRSIEDFSK